MRHLLVILMIALLPLRGWAGDAMATGMAAGQVAQMQQRQIATKSIASYADVVSVKADFDHETAVLDAVRTVADCAGHGAEDTDHGGGSHCDTCSACQACHTVALAHAAHKVSSTFQAFALPQSAVDQFASADAALRQKPPIS